MDFFTRYENGEVDSAYAYFKLLKENAAHKLRFKAVFKRDDFEKIQEIVDDLYEAQQELPDIREELDNYCEKIEGERPAPEELESIFENTEHDHFIKNIVQYLILNMEEKSNSVIIHGAANGGKTQFLIRLG